MDAPTPLDLFKLDLAVAMDLAASGRPEDGYLVLDGGLAAVEAPPEESWSEDLVFRYRQALMLFAQAHGIWFSLPPEADKLCPPSRAELVRRDLQELVTTRARLADRRQRAADTRHRAEAAREACRQARGQLVHLRSRWPSRRLGCLTDF